MLLPWVLARPLFSVRTASAPTFPTTSAVPFPSGEGCACAPYPVSGQLGIYTTSLALHPSRADIGHSLPGQLRPSHDQVLFHKLQVQLHMGAEDIVTNRKGVVFRLA